MTASLLEAYKEDIAVRLDGSQPANKTGYRVNVHEIEPGIIFRDANVAVTAFPVNHGSWPLAYGYRFQTPDRSIVISGDTAPSAGVIAHCAGCDVLVHEVYSQKGFLQRPKEWQRYHAAAHTSSRELAEIANKAKPGLLILYHQLFWGTTEEELLSEVRRTYSGRVVSARDLDIY